MLAFQLVIVASAFLRAPKLAGKDVELVEKKFSLQKLRQNPSTCKPQANNLCSPGDKSAKPILISGSPGSGTHSVVALFGMNGIGLGHESVGAYGSVSWPYMVNAKKIYNPAELYAASHSCAWLRPPETTFRHVFHVVRCPIDVISSMTSHETCSLNYESRTLGLGNTAPCTGPGCHDLEFLGKVWLAQQNLLESYTEKRFRIDEIPTMFAEICGGSGFTPEVCNSHLFPKRQHNRRTHRHVSWSEMKQRAPEVTNQLLAKAREYGFDESCTGGMDIKDVRFKENETVVEDAEAAMFNPKNEVVTTGCFNNEANSTHDGSETDCSDGLDWVWDRKTLQTALRRKMTL